MLTVAALLWVSARGGVEAVAAGWRLVLACVVVAAVTLVAHARAAGRERHTRKS